MVGYGNFDKQLNQEIIKQNELLNNQINDIKKQNAELVKLLEVYMEYIKILESKDN